MNLNSYFKVIKIGRFKRGAKLLNKMIIYTNSQGTKSNVTCEARGITLRDFGHGLELKTVNADSFLVRDLSELGFRLKRVLRRDPVTKKTVMDIGSREFPVKAPYELSGNVRTEMYFGL